MPLGLALGDRLALVVVFLAACQGHLDLGPAALEVEQGRNQRVAALADLAADTVDLAAVQQQLAFALGFVVLPAGLLVGSDVAIDQVQLTLLDAAVGVVQMRLSGAQRLDLGATSTRPASKVSSRW